jgi:hypothetical protein
MNVYKYTQSHIVILPQHVSVSPVTIIRICYNKNTIIVSSILGVSPASDFLMPTFRNHLSVPSSEAGYELHIQPLKMEQIDGSETSAFKNQTPGIHPKYYSQYSKHSESLKSRIQLIYIIYM